MAKEEKFIAIERRVGSHELQMLTDLLRQEGINARGIGSISGASVGAGEVIMGGRLEVPESQLEEATKILAVFAGEAEGAEFVDIPPELTADQAIQESVPTPDAEEAARQENPTKVALFMLALLFVAIVVAAVFKFFV